MDIKGLHERGIIKTGQALKLQSIMLYEDKEELLEYLGDILVVKDRELKEQLNEQ